eukprot:Hpha_TRINITY_DN16825_c1_g2::TRINITY_DN16825_c1_g2_i1::g.148902::m.148902
MPVIKRRSAGAKKKRTPDKERSHSCSDHHHPPAKQPRPSKAAWERQEVSPSAWVYRVTPEEAQGSLAAGGQIRNTLESLIYPLSPGDFHKDIYRKRAAVFKGGGAERVQWLAHRFLGGMDLGFQLEHTASERIHVWMRGKETGQVSFTVDTAQTAGDCWQCGASLYFRAPEDMERAFLPSVGQDLGMNFGLFDQGGETRGEIETFAAQPGHRTDWHWDFMENITIQLSGTRRWYLKGSGQSHPHRAYALHFETPGSALRRTQENLARLHDPAFRPGAPEEAECSVVLEAGDVLYHPAGIWHSVECEGEGPAVSVNLSFMPATWGSVLEATVRGVCLSEAELRERICLPGTDPLGLARGALAKKLQLLSSRLSALSPAEVLPPLSVLPPRAIREPPPVPRRLVLGADGAVRGASPRVAAAATAEAVAKLLPTLASAPPPRRSALAILSKGRAPTGAESGWGGGEWPLAGAVRRAHHFAKSAAVSAVQFAENPEEWEKGDDDEPEAEEEEEEEEEEGENEGDSIYCVHHNFGASDDAHAQIQVELSIPGHLSDLVSQLAVAAPRSPVTVPDSPAGRAVVALLLHLGYLVN